ncbi:MAG: ComF family protein [Planctomycetota bacterium]
MRRLIVQAKDMPHGAQAWALKRAAREAWREIRPGNTDGAWDSGREQEYWCATPASRKRRRADWYLPQFVGPGLAKVEGASFRPLLRRRRQRADQADLNGAERRANLQDMFRGRRRRASWPARVCLFDDVSTTGATLQEARRALLAEGVGEVRAVCLALVV